VLNTLFKKPGGWARFYILGNAFEAGGLQVAVVRRWLRKWMLRSLAAGAAMFSRGRSAIV
jgi:hypothetical protein